MRLGRAWLLVLASVTLASSSVAGEKTLRIYLARHGQTDWNLQKRDQGWKPIPLNATGEAQARALGETFRSSDVTTIYCSTLKRSQSSAEIASGGKIPVVALPDLREQRSFHADEPEIEAETTDDLYARVKSAVAGILDKHHAGSILIVGHGGTNRQILRVLLDRTAEDVSAISQNNDEIYLIEMQAGRATRLWKFVPGDRLGDL